MRFLDIQQRIDAGYEKVVLPSGVYEPKLPLFLTSSTELVGFDKYSIISGVNCGSVIYGGWKRDRLTTSHLTTSGFRTLNDASLWSKDSPWDLGPNVLGWPSVKRIQASIIFKLMAPFTGQRMPLFGIQSSEWEINNGWGVCPSPFCVWYHNGHYYLAIRTRDDVVRTFKAASASPQVGATTSFTFAITLDTGQVQIGINGVWPTVDTSQSGPNWGIPGTRLKRNRLGTFGVALLDPFLNSDEFGTERYDALITYVGYDCNLENGARWTTSATCSVIKDGYPLVNAQSSDGSKYLLAVHKTNGEKDLSNNIFLNNVRVHGSPGNRCVTLGYLQGNPYAFKAKGCEFFGGTVGIVCANFGVVYPFHTIDSWAHFHSESNYDLCNVSDGTVTRSPCEYADIIPIKLYNCGVNIDRCLFTGTENPYNTEPVFYVRGGSNKIDGINYNQEFEHKSPEALVRYDFDQADQGWHRHCLFVSNSTVGQRTGSPTQPPLVMCGPVPPANIMSTRPQLIISQGDDRERRVRFKREEDIAKVDVVGTTDIDVALPVL